MAVDQDLFGEVGKPKRKSKPRTEEQKRRHRDREAARRAANPDAHRQAVVRFRERHPDKVRAIEVQARERKRAKRDAARAASGWQPPRPLTDEERAERRRATLKKFNNKPERVAFMRQYTQDNWDRHMENNRRWADANPEKVVESRKLGYLRNRDVKLERGRAHYQRERLTPKSICKELFNGARRRARERGCEFALTKEWLLERLEAGICEVSGLQFERGSGTHHPFSPSVDRIKRSGGYTPDNARLVIWAVNNLKGIGDDETMLLVARAIVERNTSVD